MISLLTELGLVRLREGLVVQSRSGERVAVQGREDRLRVIGSLLMKGGYFNEQARVLVELGQVNNDGALICPFRFARSSAAQLIALLGLWQTVNVGSTVVIPADLLDDLGIASALLPVEADIPSWVKDRKAVGTRAEMYSVMFLRTGLADPGAIAWVARDSDDLGFDIEDRRTAPSHLVEVKGSRGLTIVINLTEREWARAIEEPTRYELHFWGGIDLDRAPLVEYASLRRLGYPRIFTNVVNELSSPAWTVTATNWRASLNE